ncbi:predicted protein [Histoplasma capsulatum G186AR]|uniref:Uncharacterized protein n=1 Tax=Ajellomyces capsulatus (strain G186AR / H82 / ATCC MYA-2454 / RMSCC 2432) TaxID=447093 RepID=C0NSZ6_AJECG|nr:uncharacterized protein HCBG_06276 [Histoplasma capsulatum G186AR]EEH05157.1 predicted protein [Histoplasma capsulatum G186AR]
MSAIPSFLEHLHDEISDLKSGHIFSLPGITSAPPSLEQKDWIVKSSSCQGVAPLGSTAGGKIADWRNETPLGETNSHRRFEGWMDLNDKGAIVTSINCTEAAAN